MEYWHNPRCSKSREALALLEQHGYRPTIREYLKDTPSADEIASVVSKLRLTSARDLMRTKDALYKELGLKDVSDEDQLIKAMADNPKLIERPVLIHDSRAALGRPVEQILDAV
ncbi:arsenate reductase (glutaredoxin) [Oceanicaulis sp.]|jgi:arsenate reductase|uniref:arsenate reductase (glutaredoxin) n=1 Tax=Oceanicaulis sp. TaxID=1924941 RepID=UPI003F70326D